LHDERNFSKPMMQMRSEKDKMDLMTFREIRERLANRDAIREQQVAEERAEAERELLEEKAKRAKEKMEQKKRAAAAAATAIIAKAQQQQHEIGAPVSRTSSTSSGTTTAAADTSSEVAKKFKDRFMKDTSKVIVRALAPYMKPDATVGKIKSSEDFKHLAKKVRAVMVKQQITHYSFIDHTCVVCHANIAVYLFQLTTYIMTKEIKHCTRIEDLKCSDSVKKKVTSRFSSYAIFPFTHSYLHVMCSCLSDH
jgi:hypothetical protein